MSISNRIDVIESRILVIRGKRVMIDADLAEMYGVVTKRLQKLVLTALQSVANIHTVYV